MICNFGWFSNMGISYLEKVKVKVAQLCLTLCNPMDYLVHGILQVRILEWVAYPFSSGSSQPRHLTSAFCIAGGFCTTWATREVQNFFILCSKPFWSVIHLVDIFSQSITNFKLCFCCCIEHLHLPRGYPHDPSQIPPLFFILRFTTIVSLNAIDQFCLLLNFILSGTRLYVFSPISVF